MYKWQCEKVNECEKLLGKKIPSNDSHFFPCSFLLHLFCSRKVACNIIKLTHGEPDFGISKVQHIPQGMFLLWVYGDVVTEPCFFVRLMGKRGVLQLYAEKGSSSCERTFLLLKWWHYESVRLGTACPGPSGDMPGWTHLCVFGPRAVEVHDSLLGDKQECHQ